MKMIVYTAPTEMEQAMLDLQAELVNRRVNAALRAVARAQETVLRMRAARARHDREVEIGTEDFYDA